MPPLPIVAQVPLRAVQTIQLTSGQLTKLGEYTKRSFGGKAANQPTMVTPTQVGCCMTHTKAAGSDGRHEGCLHAIQSLRHVFVDVMGNLRCSGHGGCRSLGRFRCMPSTTRPTPSSSTPR